MRRVLICFVLMGCGSNATSTQTDVPQTDTGADAPVGTPGTFNVFDQLPQFGMFVGKDPQNYTPPPGVMMWKHGTEWAIKLTAAQQAQIGADLAARVTYHAQCDNYDRLGGVFFLVEPKGQEPLPTHPRTEIVRFITPFSDYRQGAHATLVYPDADISAYASTLADTSKDVWIGFYGGSNPYAGDPCHAAGASVTPEFAAVGFKYSLDLVSTLPLAVSSGTTLTPISYVSETTVPITATFENPGDAVTGYVTVIVSGHGAAAGGNEYRKTQDTVTLNGEVIGSFNTKIDCEPYAAYSPDGNPNIFKNNLTTNPRNWCPGALVPSHRFAATLARGANALSLGIVPSLMPSGSNYSTTITFSAP